MMETKTNKARTLLNSGNIVEAMQIVKTFKIGVTKEERRTIQIAYETMTGNERFYRQLQLDTEQIKEKAILTIKKILL